MGKVLLVYALLYFMTLRQPLILSHKLAYLCHHSFTANFFTNTNNQHFYVMDPYMDIILYFLLVLNQIWQTMTLFAPWVPFLQMPYIFFHLLILVFYLRDSWMYLFNFEHNYSLFEPQHPYLLVLPPQFDALFFLSVSPYWFVQTQYFLLLLFIFQW